MAARKTGPVRDRRIALVNILTELAKNDVIRGGAGIVDDVASRALVVVRHPGYHIALGQ